MADPLSIAASAAGLISLGIQVTHSLVEFYNSYKSQDSTLAGTVERLEWLTVLFESLENTLNRPVQPEEQNLMKSIEISVKKSDELIYELREECQKFHQTSSNGVAAAVRVAGRRLTYPFRESTLRKLDEDIDEIRRNLSFALDILQFKSNQRNQDDMAEVKAVLELVRTHQMSSDLRDWLKAPDATVDHNAACAKKYPGTGTWLVKSPMLSRWLIERNSILWLNGFAGSGKSVLCSTVIQFALRHRRSDSSVGIAFFYFTFNDDSKRDESGMLRALLLQLSGQLQDGEKDLTRLRHSYKDSLPPSLGLIECLRRMIQRFHHVYIALDGLDESPRDEPREKVLDTLNDIRSWRIHGLHLFLTSRDEPDIRDSLDLSNEQQVIMRNEGLDKDIADFISGRLDTDRRLQKWLPYREIIQETLTKRAKGVFRWVQCQFKTLQSCPRSEDHLNHLLDSLPQSLDETYERMLCNIDPCLIEDARRILTLLCFAARPLTVRELIDGVAVRISNPQGLNYKRRLRDFNDLHAICPGFIEVAFVSNQATETHHQEILMSTVRIAHFSVQEYLKSDRIRHQKAAIFSMSGTTAHAEIAQICLVYLLEGGLSGLSLGGKFLEDYPLAHFAAFHWIRHCQYLTKSTTELNELVFRLFQRRDFVMTWIKLYDGDIIWVQKEIGALTPLYILSGGSRWQPDDMAGLNVEKIH
ncbi:hypothetical protein MMC07_004096 [Pseudocyphellaria aurata]|nr:hypothetical protein [Pseudocyphellaria aurata]